jgi:hypothetical protein
LDLGYYDWVWYFVWYWDPSNDHSPAHPLILGRWLGREYAHGPAMCYKVLKPNGHWIVWSSFTILTDANKRYLAVNDSLPALSIEPEAIIGKFDPSFIL